MWMPGYMTHYSLYAALVISHMHSMCGRQLFHIESETVTWRIYLRTCLTPCIICGLRNDKFSGCPDHITLLQVRVSSFAYIYTIYIFRSNDTALVGKSFSANFLTKSHFVINIRENVRLVKACILV